MATVACMSLWESFDKVLQLFMHALTLSVGLQHAAPTHTHGHTCTHTQAHIYRHMHAHTHTDTCTDTHTHGHMHGHTHTCGHMHTHTHKHRHQQQDQITCILFVSVSPSYSSTSGTQRGQSGTSRWEPCTTGMQTGSCSCLTLPNQRHSVIYRLSGWRWWQNKKRKCVCSV